MIKATVSVYVCACVYTSQLQRLKINQITWTTVWRWFSLFPWWKSRFSEEEAFHELLFDPKIRVRRMCAWQGASNLHVHPNKWLGCIHKDSSRHCPGEKRAPKQRSWAFFLSIVSAAASPPERRNPWLKLILHTENWRHEKNKGPAVFKEMPLFKPAF